MTDTLIIPPDAEKLFVHFLLDQDEVTAICQQAIFTELPASKVWPAVRVSRIGGAPDYSVPLRHETARLQVDCFGGPKATAHRLAQTCRAVTAARVAGTHEEAVVQEASFGDLVWLPDDTLAPAQPARPRYAFDVSLRIRPRSDVTS